eukprot:m.17116 g.17116  ORF g.17116 m.17116 type:complete len:582 (+) comp5908_c0_seq1:79-1824(+)
MPSTVAEPTTNVAVPETQSELPQEEKLDHETELWRELSSDAWQNSVTEEKSIFTDLYEDTRKELEKVVASGEYDVIVDVGVGTGEITGPLKVSVPRIGLDINPAFIQTCQKNFGEDKGISFHVGDATALNDWWTAEGFDKKYKKPLVICCNNTIMIMPASIRGTVVEEMRRLAGDKGKCLMTFWNGRVFAHGVLGFYKENPSLCGNFDLSPTYVDWKARTIVTDTGYSSTWLTSNEVSQWVHSLLMDVDLLELGDNKIPAGNYVREQGCGIYFWFHGYKTETRRSSIGDFYDSEDVQKFYSTVSGQHATHIGAYETDTIPADNLQAVLELVRSAQTKQEANIIDKVLECMGSNHKFRVADLGCGYGTLLQRLAKKNVLWSGIGVDVSETMIETAKEINAKESTETQESIEFERNSFVKTSVENNGIDAVVSMDAFMHAGKDRHADILKEAWRMLRPGGWLVFSDLLEKEGATIPSRLYETRAWGPVEAFGSKANYIQRGEELGFGNASFLDASENISRHYAALKAVLESTYKTEDSSQKLDVSEEFYGKMSQDLEEFQKLAPTCLQYGIIAMQKVGQPKSA